MKRRFLGVLMVGLGLSCTSCNPPVPVAVSLVLVTLDTTRADFVGAYGAPSAQTHHLDRLADRGTRFATAVSASPLTLPSHASLMTGLDPPEHGIQDNGTSSLEDDFLTLAEVLAHRGYATGAFVASAVLDRRFGLDQGFQTYDDALPAEDVGQYGYPERDAAAVTSAALQWLQDLPGNQPYFLWVHYYDPHAPYGRPGDPSSRELRYAGEIALVDRELGRLLDGVDARSDDRVVAAVGDHGESLGEHGEETHGIFLYRASLDVPLIVQGKGVPQGRVVGQMAATRGLATTLLDLTSSGPPVAALGSGLPGLSRDGSDADSVYSSSWMPASAYGWSPLEAVTDRRFRFVNAPRVELYDLLEDPRELNNIAATKPHEVRRLAALLASFQARRKMDPVSAPESVDSDLLKALRTLGYVSGSRPGEDPIDPKDGILLLADFEAARELIRTGDIQSGLAILERICKRNPRNIPFLTHRAQALLDSGRGQEALTAFRRAVALNPGLDFTRFHLAETYRHLGQTDLARQEYRAVVDLNPRFSGAWLALAESAALGGDPGREYDLLSRAVEEGTSSSAIHCRLGQIEGDRGNEADSDAHFERATRLSPEWGLAWVWWGRQAEGAGRFTQALSRYERAVSVEPSSLDAHLSLGRLRLGGGDRAGARPHLEKVVALSPGTPQAVAARRLLRR